VPFPDLREYTDANLFVPPSNLLEDREVVY
jgi:hypothetical protein